jgi:hypothetical protein
MFRELAAAALLSIATTDVMAADAVSTAEVQEIAKEAYIYGVPTVSMYGTMWAFSVDKGGKEYKGPFNTVLNIARVFTPDDHAFVTPNSDTPYSFMGLDLRAEPVVIIVPPMDGKRYFVFQLMDLYTFNFDYIGTRTTGNGGGSFLIAGPEWNGDAPAGITKVIRSETEFVNVVGRTQLFNPDDLEHVEKIQAGYKVEPLSKFLGRPAPSAAPEIAWINPIPPKDMKTSLEFFNVLAFALQFAPPHPSELELRNKFASIGIEPGRSFDVNALPSEMKAALEAGMAEGQKEIDARRAATTDTGILFGTRDFLKNDYVARAVGTQVGIGANSREEALYPIYEKDTDGDALDGTSGSYTLHFAAGQFPPVNAFWSVTMYDLPGQLLVANPLNRYLINAPMLPHLKLDAAGGLTIYIQNASPGAEKEANWLPAPKGPFMIAMRYYLPKPELLSGEWKSPGISKAN